MAKVNPYLKRFVNSFASENIIGVFSRYKNACKEITESWAMYEAAKKYVDDLDTKTVIVIGDGCSPRTSVIFAYFTKAHVISIDPLLNVSHWEEHYEKQMKMGYTPERIVLIPKRVEDVEVGCYGRGCVVVWPHSHAPMNNTRISNYKSRVDIAMPCCIPIPNNWAAIPHIVYNDYNVLSPKNTIHVWKEGALK